MNQAFEETKYYCKHCTARKYEGWKYCPFCGSGDHYYGNDANGKTSGSGVVRPTKQTVNDINGAQAQTQTAKGESPQDPISSEDEQFEQAVKTLRWKYDNLKRARRQRDQAERELKEKIQIIEQLQGEKQNVLDENSALHQQLSEARRRRPEPIRISQVFGQRPDSDLCEVLPLITVHQDAGQGCVITVGLRK